MLIDDGSTDASGAMCDGYAGEDARIRVIHQTNQGVSAARNLGIETASGVYVTFLDADDELFLNAIERMGTRCTKAPSRYGGGGSRAW